MKKLIKKRKNDSSETTHKKRKKNKRFWYYFLIVVIVFALIFFLAGIGFCYYIVKSAPEFDLEKMFEKEATRIYDANGELIATLGTEQRQKITYDDLPEVLIDAIIATEDSRFFQHNGFDAPRFLKASISQVLGKGGGGASTLTMQLSKLSFTSTEDSGIKGIIRKFTDIYMAVFKMEKNLTKEEIIEYYVNTPCMGGSIYGVQQASQYYFGKDVQDLNLVEAAQIAGMFQSPNGYNPILNPNDANTRKNTVLYLMKRHGYITDTEYQAGISIKIADLVEEGSLSTSEYQGFIDTVVQEIIDDTGNNPYNVPMDIYTTMVKEKQDVINDFYSTFKFRDDKVEVGVAVVDNDTGALIAVGAGRYKTSAMTLNVATFHGQTERAPGSTIKPILDYGPAIEYENLSTYGPFIDEKTTYAGDYMRNFSTGFKGFTSMRDCLKNSVNTCALQAYRLTTKEQKVEFAKGLGITFENDEIMESYAIGTFNGMTPVKLASAYAAFGNGGYYTEAYSYNKIVYRETEEIYEPERKRTRAMKATTAYMISSVLTGATSSSVRVSGTQIATKTGTTSYDKEYLAKFGLKSNVIPDAWVSSYSPDYAVAIWYGYTSGLNSETVKNKEYLNNNTSSSERIKIQAALCNKIYEKNSKFTMPKGIVSSQVEMETIPAKLPSENTPSSLIGTYYFISGTEPSEVSTRYSQLSDPTNLTYTTSGNTLTLSWTPINTPDAIDTSYLRTYFTENYGEWADQYYEKRIEYNNTNIGTLGYEIYLTQGEVTTYLGYTDASTYSIDTTQYVGAYDGVIIKSAYSIYKTNSSSGAKLSFTIPTVQDETETQTNTNTNTNTTETNTNTNTQ